MLIVIEGEVYSKKNSRQFVGTKGKPRLLPSKQYRQWADDVLWQLKVHPAVGRRWKYPLTAYFKFYRKTKRRFDYNNLSQGPLDLLVDAGIIEDDSMNHIIPNFSAGWAIDKKNPRVEIFLEEK